MLILVTGAPGTCKKPTRKFMFSEHGFEDHTGDFNLYQSWEQMWDCYLTALGNYSMASHLAEKSDVVVSFSPWEVVLIGAPIRKKFFNNDLVSSLTELNAAVIDKLRPPDAILHLKSSYQLANQLMSMNGYPVSQDVFDAIEEAYNGFFERIVDTSIHVVENQENQKIFLDDIRFSISSFKSAHGGSGTIWDRHFLKEK